MNHKEIMTAALDLKVKIEELRSATYTVVSHNYADKSYLFIASFSLASLEYEFNITDENFVEIKGLAQIPDDVVVAYGDFIRNIKATTTGADNPYTLKPRADTDQPEPQAPKPADAHIGSDEAKLR